MTRYPTSPTDRCGVAISCGPACAHLLDEGLGAGCHHANAIAFSHHAVDDAHQGDDAAIGVEVAIEDERAQRSIGVTCRRGNVVHNRFKQIMYAGPGFAEARIASSAGMAKPSSISAFTRSGSAAGRSILLIKGNDLKVRVHRHHGVGHGLRLNALGGIDHEHSPVASRKRPTDFVGEVDVTGCVDQVKLIRLTVIGCVVDANRLAFDGNSALALDIHGIESCSVMSRLATVPVSSRMRSESVDFPWSMCAMMEKFLI